MSSLTSAPTPYDFDNSRQQQRESLLSDLLEGQASLGARPRAESSRIENLLKARTVGDALRCWFGSLNGMTQEEIVRALNGHVALIDKLLNEQLNAVIHHPRFQELEASWRGLERLTNQVEEESADDIKVKFLDSSWRELERDFERAIDFDQSQLWNKVYEQEFGMPGGEPFGVLIGDYEIDPKSTKDRPHNDLRVLESISGVAAASFCPFIASASPAMFGLDEFSELQAGPDLARGFAGKDYIKWRSFRDSDDARFVGLTLPRVLARLPYADDGRRIDRFCFHEDVRGPDASKFLWGNSAFAFGEVLIRAYARSGWLAGIRGVERDVVSHGLVARLPVQSFSTDKKGVAPKCSTDVLLTDLQEKELSGLGFIPLCHCHDTQYSAFYSNESVHKPKKYDRDEATRNERISNMLQYTLCASRFAHYLKAIVRDKVGSSVEPEECERILHDWIIEYVNPDADASPDAKATRPLREARIAVRRDPADPGKFHCVFHLWPHFELDDLLAAVRLDTTLGPELHSGT